MEKKKKERKKRHRAGRQKKDPAFRRRQRAGNKRFISGGGLFGLLPDSIFEGFGDSPLTTVDRYAYSVSVPRMYNIAGRERVEALCSTKWHEAWEAHHQQQVTRAAQEKKKQAERWEKAKR